MTATFFRRYVAGQVAGTVLGVMALLSLAQAIEIARVDVKPGPLMLRDDGTVWTWGAPRMDDRSPIGPWTAHAIIPLEHIVAIGAGCAVDRSGHVWTFTVGRATLVDGIDAAFMATGGFAAAGGFAVRRDGTVWSWRNKTDDTGWSWHNKTGGTEIPPPVQIQGLEDVIAVDARFPAAVALTRSGDVWTWNEYVPGERGSLIVKRTAPVHIDGLKDIVAVAAGLDHALALGRDGHVWAWGKNYSGQLGDDTGTDRAQPVQVTDISNVTGIAAGSAYSFALRKGGTVWAWGTNGSGQLGDGSMALHRHPVPVKDLNHVIAISAAIGGGLALCEDGSVWAWGSNSGGELGYAKYRADRSTWFSTVPQRIPRVTWQTEPVADAGQSAPRAAPLKSGATPTAPPAATARPSGVDEQLQYGLDDLRSPDRTVRQRGTLILGSLGAGARPAIPELERVMQSEDAALRSAAWRAYIDIMRGDPAGLPTIVAALSDSGARNRAEGVLRSIGAPAVTLILEHMPRADGPTLESMTRVLEIADLTKQNPTLVAATVDVLIPGLSDPDPETQRRTAAALVPFGQLARKAAPPLVRLLDTSKVEQTRRAAVRALGAMGPEVPEVMPALAKALRSEFRVSADARQALESIGTPEAKSILAEWRRETPK